MRGNSLTSLFFVLVCFASNAHAVVLSGTITGWDESSTRSWGDGVHDVTMVWSTHSDFGVSGWFCGTNCSEQNADAYHYPHFTNPTSIADASTFGYLPNNFVAEEGDTIFYKTLAGYYGAFVIQDIYPNPAYPDPGATEFVPHTILDGRWYFQTDSSGDFAGAGGHDPVVPGPATILLVGTGLIGACLLKRRGRR